MLKKKLAVICLISAVATSSLVGCKKTETTVEPAATAAKDYSKEVTISVVKSTGTSVPVSEQDLWSPKMKEMFNMKWDVQDVPTADFDVKVSMLFASNQSPDYLIGIKTDNKSLPSWISGGYLKGYTLDEFKSTFPEFIKNMSNEQLEKINKYLKQSDGKQYQIMTPRADSVNNVMLYRKDFLEENNIPISLKNPDEMYNMLKTFKDKTGKIPYVSPSAGVWAFTPIFQMFGLPEMIITQLSYYDPVDKTYVPYAFSEERYRKSLTYINKLYKEGLIWKEFSTATKDQIAKFQADGNGVIQWDTAANVAKQNSQTANTFPNAKWDWFKELPTSFSDRTFYKRTPAYNGDAPAIAAAIDKDKYSRLVDYLNWASTNEGKIFNTYGVEGVTYDLKDGKPVFRPEIQTSLNPKGKELGRWNIGGVRGTFVGNFLPDYKATYSAATLEMEKAFLDKPKYYYFDEPVVQFTEAEQSKIVDYQTNLNQLRDEYSLKFIMGQLDPSNDADWKKFTDALKKVGLDDYVKIRTEAYKRVNK
jgi:putative aldouronate transport system substrate-binding protein